MVQHKMFSSPLHGINVVNMFFGVCSHIELTHSSMGLMKARYTFSLFGVELILRWSLSNCSVMFAFGCCGIDVAFPAGVPMDGDVKILCRCHTVASVCVTCSQNCVSVTVLLFVFSDKQPDTFCWVEGHFPALLPFCKLEEILL